MLQVLYRFLDYFSKFDWEKYCISLNGPIHLSSLPDVVGNFYRIRSAFTYGARKLGQILSQPEESIGNELHKFFSNTLNRHGNGQRPDVQDSTPLSRFRGFGVISSVSGTGTESCQEDLNFYESESSNSSIVTANCRSDNEGSLNKVNNGNMSGRETNWSGTSSEEQGSANSACVSEIRLTGDAKDLATSKTQGLEISNDAHKFPQSGLDRFSSSGSASVRHAPHLYYCNSSLDNGEMRNGKLEHKQPGSSNSTKKNASSGIFPAGSEEMGVNQLVASRGVQSPVGQKTHPLISNSAWSSEDLYPGHSGYPPSSSSAGSQEVLSSMSDLCGDYDSNMRSLSYGQRFYDNAFSAPVPPNSSALVSQFQVKNSWDVVRNSVQFRWNAISPMNANGVVPQHAYYPVNSPVIHGSGFGMEDVPKPRGTGTYFPNPSMNYYKDRSLTPRGRNPAPTRSPRNNDHVVTPLEPNSPERRSCELAQIQTMNQGVGKSVFLELRHSGSEKVLSSSANDSLHPPDRLVEFGSIGVLPLVPASAESSKQRNPGSPDAQNSTASRQHFGNQRLKSAASMDQNRILVQVQSFRLKDEEDFPPLSM